MNRSKRLTTGLLLCFCALLSVGSLAAQVPGDYLLSDIRSNRIHATQPGSPLSPIFVPRVNHMVDDVIMDRDNAHMLVVETGTSSSIASGVTRFNPTTVVVNYGGETPTDLGIDGYGRYFATSFGSFNGITTGSGGTFSTIRAGIPGLVVALTEDVDTGGYCVVTSTGDVLRIGVGGGIRTLASLGGVRATDIEHDGVTGDFIVSSYSLPHVRRIDRNTGATTSSFNFWRGVAGINLRDNARQLDACGWVYYQSVDLTGTPTSALGAHAASNFVAITRYGQRKVTGRGPGTPGSDYFIDLNFPNCAFKGYVTGISFGLRPSIPVGTTHEIAMAADSLFVNALSGALDGSVLFNRIGSLDANGEGTTRLRIPPTAPAGTRIFATAVSLCPSGPNGLAVADTIGVTVR